MNWREFIMAMTDHAAWPVAVVLLGIILLLTQRERIGKLIDRDWKAEVHGIGTFAADASEAELVAAVSEAVQPSEQLLRDTEERQRDIEKLIRLAARWGQEIAESMPRPRNRGVWEPTIQWSRDGTPITICLSSSSAESDHRSSLREILEPDTEGASGNDSR